MGDERGEGVVGKERRCLGRFADLVKYSTPSGPRTLDDHHLFGYGYEYYRWITHLRNHYQLWDVLPRGAGILGWMFEVQAGDEGSEAIWASNGGSLYSVAYQVRKQASIFRISRYRVSNQARNLSLL